MSDLQQIEQEKNIKRWGGLCGIIGGILFLIVFAFVIIFILPEPSVLKDRVIRFPDIKNLRVIENLVYLTALLMIIPLITALYQTLKKLKPALALLGFVFIIIGLASMIISSTPHVAHSKISALLQASITKDLETITLIWQAIGGIFEAMLYIGFLVIPVGFIFLGKAMFGTKVFGKGFGLVSMILGIIGVTAALLQLIFPASDSGALSYFSIIIFSFIFGTKTFKASKV
ncbi:MAG: hypothetical protein GY756_23735 [bacterium]|nr:hypothetical protein [bacterium]